MRPAIPGRPAHPPVHSWRVRGSLLATATLLLLLAPPGPLGSAAQAGEARNQCQKTAHHMFSSCLLQARADFWVSVAKCDNLPTQGERIACRQEARAALEAALQECEDQYDARLEICGDLGGPYDPVIDPAHFVDGIDNPFLPMIPGTTMVYESVNEDGDLEHNEVEVTHDTKEILGVTCTVVHDTVEIEGQLAEDTYDWYAQDDDGNVWYFGELSMTIEDGELVSLEGSWTAGLDGAKPGIVMLADPQIGELYRQEFSAGEAEDMAGVLSLSETATVPLGTFEHCLMTRDFSPLEPDVLEHKFYAPGVGVVLEENPDTGVRVELVEIRTE